MSLIYWIKIVAYDLTFLLQNYFNAKHCVFCDRSYRKIPGDHCEGGITPERKEIDLSKKCVSNLLKTEQLVGFYFITDVKICSNIVKYYYNLK